jgi:hypothetical protein
MAVSTVVRAEIAAPTRGYASGSAYVVDRLAEGEP